MHNRETNNITKTLAVLVILILLAMVTSSGFQPYTSEAYLRFLLIAFMAFLGVPLMWITLRGEKAGDTGEKDMLPEDLTQIHKEDLENGYIYPDYFFQPGLHGYDPRKKRESKEK
jgi:hypothetical protein